MPQQRFSLYVPARGLKTNRVTQPLPKQSVFPLNTPMTVEERALVSFATRAPQQQLEDLAKWQNEPLAPLEVAPVRIEPLSIDDSTKAGEGANDYVD
jgi:hypothetical protein